jgi:hypothetical protein
MKSMKTTLTVFAVALTMMSATANAATPTPTPTTAPTIMVQVSAGDITGYCSIPEETKLARINMSIPVSYDDSTQSLSTKVYSALSSKLASAKLYNGDSIPSKSCLLPSRRNQSLTLKYATQRTSDTGRDLTTSTSKTIDKATNIESGDLYKEIKSRCPSGSTCLWVSWPPAE